MADIAIRKSAFDGLSGLLNNIMSNLGNYNASLNELKKTAEGIDSNTCNLDDAIGDIVNSDKKDKEKVKQIQALNKKLEDFIDVVANKEKAAKNKIVEKKKEFYKKYEHLRPECEKSIFRRAGELIVKKASELYNFLKEHIVAVLIILAAIVLVIVCPASALLVIGAVVAAVSAIMTIADLVCMGVTGMDMAGFLESKGMGNLAKLWNDVGIGLDIASIIIPGGAAIKAGFKTLGKAGMKKMAKDSLKNSLKSIKNGAVKLGKTVLHPIKSLKTLGAGIGKNITRMKNSFKAVGGKEFFKNGLKKVGKGALDTGKSLIGIDDIQNIKKIKTLSKMTDKEIAKGLKIKLSGDSLKEYSVDKLEKGRNFKIAVDNNNFNHVSLENVSFDVDNLYERLTGKADENNINIMYKQRGAHAGELRSRSEMNAVIRREIQKETNTKLLDRINDSIAGNGVYAKEFMEKTGIDTTLRGKRNPNKMTMTQFKSELRRNHITPHEDFGKPIVQYIKGEYNANIKHNGFVARMQDMLFDADARRKGSLYTKIGSQEVLEPSIYGGANFTPKKNAQELIDRYKYVSGITSNCNLIRQNVINTKKVS